MTQIFIPGPCGKLEAIIYNPEIPRTNITTIICHPNPLFQGTMHNKVVTTLSKVCETLKIHSIKFNYRGVGESDGTYGNIIGEVDDLLAVARWVQNQRPNDMLWLFGFSFGAYIAAKGATLLPCQQLVSIAPAVGKAPFDALPPITCPWIIVQGEADEVIPPQEVFTYAERRPEQPTLLKMPETSHFFHHRLIELHDNLIDYLLVSN